MSLISEPYTEYIKYIFQTIQISATVKDEQKFFTTQSGWFLKTLTRTKESRLTQKAHLQNVGLFFSPLQNPVRG